MPRIYNNQFTNGHGKRHTRIYSIYHDMYKRCNCDTNLKNKKHYIEKNITVCEEWSAPTNGFMNFYNWALNNGYNDKLSLDRIEVNKGYSPNNCRFVDQSMQLYNQNIRKRNTSGFTGVKFNKNTNKWTAQINIGKKRYHLGTFEFLQEAVIARKDAENILIPKHLEELKHKYGNGGEK